MAAIGDVTGGGYPDALAVTTEYNDPVNDRHLFVYWQDGAGHLAGPMSYPVYPDGTCSQPYCGVPAWIGITLVEINDDGAVDVVLANKLGISVFLTDGNGGLTLAAFIQYPVAQPSRVMLQTADVDLDGRLDVVMNETFGLWWLRNADGKLKPPVNIPVVRWPVSFVTADVTGDGHRDIVIQYQGIRVYAHDGVGGFETTPTWASGPFPGEVDQFDVGDISGDGIPDLVVTQYIGDGVHIFRGLGAGQFAPAVPLGSTIITNTARNVRIADMNRDGRNDIVLVGGARFVYYRHKPDHTFALPKWTYFADWYVLPQGVAIGDISSDDCLDVVATTLWSGMLVLYGICADYNCDGVLDGSDFLISAP